MRAINGSARIITAPTAIEAQRKYDELQRNYHVEAQLVSYAGDTAIDLSKYVDNEPLTTVSDGLTRHGLRPGWLHARPAGEPGIPE